VILLNLKQEYLQLSVFFALSFTLSVLLLLLSYSLSKKQKNEIEKLSAYECGFDPFGTGGSSFEVHFYVVGVLFIIFDLEILFLYPWAIHLGVLGGSGFVAGICFISILTVGLIYEWKKGALDWSCSKTRGLVEIPADRQRLKVQTAARTSAEREGFICFILDVGLSLALVLLSAYFNEVGLLIVFLSASYRRNRGLALEEGVFLARVYIITFLVVGMYLSPGGWFLTGFVFLLAALATWDLVTWTKLGVLGWLQKRPPAAKSTNSRPPGRR
jgi:NADH-quinone oxidoreductase subunit A